MRLMNFSAYRPGARLLTVLLCLLVLAAGCRHKKYENPITKDTQQPDKVLLDKAFRDIEKGRYEVARLTLNTLINTYDTSEFLAKAKLAIADSWMREGGSAALANAEAEYKDFILFYPTMEESAEAQMKVCDLHFKQMEKPDRDPAHVLKAEDECRNVLTQFPNSRYAPQAAQRLREVQEVVGEGEFRVGSFYHHKGSFPAAANRLQAITDHYPLFSAADQALWRLGDSYSHMGARFRPKSVSAFQRIVREYPLSPLVVDAKDRLNKLEAEIPEADPVALARMKYEQENHKPLGWWGRQWEPFSKSPNVTSAAKSGQPAMTVLRPSVPASVPVPAGAAGGVTDVTVSTTPATGALETQPDARQNQPGAAAEKPAEKPAEALPANSPTLKKGRKFLGFKRNSVAEKAAAAKKAEEKKDSKKSESAPKE
jgi:outer membrane protein assembly factor BamD